LVDAVGAKAHASGRPLLAVGPDQTREFRVLVTAYGGVMKASMLVTFTVRDLEGGEIASASDYFRSPEGRR
jgi:hypothetical protein